MEKAYNFIICILSIFALISCGEDRTQEYFEKTQENQWIYSTMQNEYLWREEIKKPERSNFFTTPEKFFSSLLNKQDKASFFTDTISSHDYGMSVALMRDPIGEKPSQVYALVLFVEPNSPADIAGIKRGTWISAVDNKKLTTSSEKTLLRGDGVKLTTEYIEFDNEANSFFWIPGDTIEVPASANYDACDIAIDSIYTVRDKKVGYILCNSFDGEDFTEKVQIIVEEFITQNVTDVIIDLRYNSGGSLSNTANLASMLIPSNMTGTPFSILKDNNEDVDTVYNYTEQNISIGDKKIYFIIGEKTKGSAELLVSSVNASKDMYDVYVVGEKSAGVNIVVEEIISPYGFAINLATTVAYLANGEILSGEGINPDFSYDELEQKNSIYPLGDEQEYLLYNTFYIIANGTSATDGIRY